MYMYEYIYINEVFSSTFYLVFLFLFFISEIKSRIRGSSNSVNTFVTIVGKSGKDFLTPRTLILVSYVRKNVIINFF